MATTPKIPERPDEKPVPGPKGPQTPYPVNDPPMPEPGTEPGTEPDFVPGTPGNPPGQI
jgi:hypothetical protein